MVILLLIQLCTPMLVNVVDHDYDNGREEGLSTKEQERSSACKERALAGGWLCRAEGEKG